MTYALTLWGASQRAKLHTACALLIVLLILGALGGFLTQSAFGVSLSAIVVLVFAGVIALITRELRRRYVWVVRDGTLDTGHGSVPLTDVDRLDLDERGQRLELILKNGEQRPALIPSVLAAGGPFTRPILEEIRDTMNQELTPFIHPDVHA